ncbi:MAG: 1-acyl-sn-glycerol-3-phosphate acyltransferase [Burkholderiaceae bacterium]|nr:1-acyl-sn-glycerol-3-phosphate acyltransferase [Burkholderiaceae bacterium]
MRYRVLRSIATVALRWYYRSVEVRDLAQFPSDGPVIVAANHWTALIDALIDALIIAAALDRPVRLTEKATLLTHPRTRLVAQAVGIIPLRRTRDEQHVEGASAANFASSTTAAFEARSAQSFDAILDALQQGEVVLIFAAGRSHSEPVLDPDSRPAVRALPSWRRLNAGCLRFQSF